MAMGRGRLPTRRRVGSHRIRDVSRETVPVGRRRRRSAAGSWPGRPLHRGRLGVSRETVRVAGDRGGASALLSRSAAGVVAWPAVGFVAGSAVGSRSGRAFHVKRSRWWVDRGGSGARSSGQPRADEVGRAFSRETVSVPRGWGRVGARARGVSRGRSGRAGVSRETVPVVRGSRRVGRALVGSAAGGQVGRAFHVKWCRCCGLGRVGARALSRVGVRAGRGVRGQSAVGSGSGGRFARTVPLADGPRGGTGARSCRVDRRAVVGVGVSRETVPVADAARGGPTVVGWSARRFT
jgi:hypothetical protein